MPSCVLRSGELACGSADESVAAADDQQPGVLGDCLARPVDDGVAVEQLHARGEARLL